MSTMIQVRNVPDAIHTQLKARAALAGLSLSDYVLIAIKRTLERPTLDELVARLERHGDHLKPSSAAIVRAERDR